MSTDPGQAELQDALLIEFTPRSNTPLAFAEALGHLCAELSLPTGGDLAFFAMEEPRVTAYLRGVALGKDIGAIGASAQKHFTRIAGSGIEVSRLSAVRVFPGASRQLDAQYHYVVRTDVAAGGENELERWYDEEHMPGLAAVPGVVLAQRLVSLDQGPKYYACYDLVSPEVLKSPPWLAVRETEWSSRVRPTFRHTRRIVSRRLVSEDMLKASAG